MFKYFLLYLFFIPGYKAFSQDDSLNYNRVYVGFNIPRLVAGDVELQALYLSRHDAIGLSCGYDYNTIGDNFVRTVELSSTRRANSIEEKSNPSGRYWYGSGLALRFFGESKISKISNRYLAIEILYKARNYRNHSYGDDGFVYLESGDQNILGVSLYFETYEKISNRFLWKYFWGFGLRMLNGQVTRPEYYYDQRLWPETHLNEKVVMPTIHLGIAMFTKI